MQRIIVVLILAVLASYGYGKYQSLVKTQHAVEAGVEIGGPSSAAAPVAAPVTETPIAAAFRCDGRTYCSQMTSCAEATYFLKNCPGTKMDGNHDGVPCERQWCK